MENVEISPSELRFRFALNKQLLGTITISNQSNSRVAFKVKTTAPKKVCLIRVAWTLLSLPRCIYLKSLIYYAHRSMSFAHRQESSRRRARSSFK